MRLPVISRLGAKRDKIAAFVQDSSQEPHAQTFASVDSDPISTATAPESGRIEGFLERVDEGSVVGWAYDPTAPHRRLLIEAAVGDEVTIVLADIYRQDLLNAGKGDGRHGFAATLNREVAGADYVRVRVMPSGHELTGSPVKTDIVSLVAHSASRASLELLGSEARLAGLASQGKNVASAGVASGYPTRAKVDTLFAPARPEIDPEGLISRYVEFEFHRFKLDQTFSINGNLTERLKVLHWYLAAYGPHRKLALPLSRQQIGFLNSQMPVVGLGVELSIAAYSFVRNELGIDRDLKNDAHLREALYWWCFERSIQFAPGGELITPSQVKALTYAGPEESGKKFPLNYFVRRTKELDASLGLLNLDLVTDRAVLICILALRCGSRPHLAQFLPRRSMTELLATARGESSTNFDRLLALAFEPDVPVATASLPEAVALISSIESRLRQDGFSLFRSDVGMHSVRADAALCLVDDPNISPGLDDGIAVIGPAGATSGLGQATRLSVDVLTHAGLDPVVLDFGLDNPAPIGFTSIVNAPKLLTPRAINLIHLNAESIPLAFAYINKSVFDRSYNIGYFFWELNQIPKCHYLALDMLDEIWVSSEYNREIYARFANIPVRNVGMAVEPLPEFAPTSRQELGLLPDEFVFLATFDSFSFIERKNPLAVLAAFQRAFPAGSGEGVRLILKTQNRARVGDPHQLRIWQAIDDVVQRDGRIRIVDETLSYRELLGFKKACDCYVSLHRSEGWGFGLIEAMQLGLPVIATAYSGNMDFCTPENCFLVDYDLVQPMPAEYIFVERGSLWAEPSVASAAASMRQVFGHRDEAKARADVAIEQIKQRFSVESTSVRYRQRVDEIRSMIMNP